MQASALRCCRSSKVTAHGTTAMSEPAILWCHCHLPSFFWRAFSLLSFFFHLDRAALFFSFFFFQKHVVPERSGMRSGNILCSLAAVNPLTHGPGLSISSAESQSHSLWKSPTCYSTDCDHVEYFSGLRPRSEGHYQPGMLSRLLVVWRRRRFCLKICLRGGAECLNLASESVRGRRGERKRAPTDITCAVVESVENVLFLIWTRWAKEKYIYIVFISRY